MQNNEKPRMPEGYVYILTANTAKDAEKERRQNRGAESAEKCAVVEPLEWLYVPDCDGFAAVTSFGIYYIVSDDDSYGDHITTFHTDLEAPWYSIGEVLSEGVYSPEQARMDAQSHYESLVSENLTLMSAREERETGYRMGLEDAAKLLRHAGSPVILESYASILDSKARLGAFDV